MTVFLGIPDGIKRLPPSNIALLSPEDCTKMIKSLGLALWNGNFFYF